jgi:arsenite-transporting ATPase
MKIHLFDDEVVGLERLKRMAAALYSETDPAQILYAYKPYEFTSEDSAHTLKVRLPFAEKEHIDLYRETNELIIRIGSFKRHVPLPHKLLKSRVTSANYRDDYLIIRMEEPPQDSGKD